MNQLGLDFTNTPRAPVAPGRKEEPARSRRSDPATSQRAASKVRQFDSGHFALIMEALAQGPANFKEIAERCGLERHAVARRLPELRDAGKVRRTDQEREGCAIWSRA